MPHDAQIAEAQRRRVVGTKASVALNSSIAALTIQSALAHGGREVSPRAFQATNKMLQFIDDLVEFKGHDQLAALLKSEEVVVEEAAEPFAAIARAASIGQPATDGTDVSEILAALGMLRASVECDLETRQVRVHNKELAVSLQGLLEDISRKELTDASEDDRLNLDAYAVACR